MRRLRTGAKGTRRTRGCPAHSRHNRNRRHKKTPTSRYGRCCAFCYSGSQARSLNLQRRCEAYFLSAYIASSKAHSAASHLSWCDPECGADALVAGLSGHLSRAVIPPPRLRAKQLAFSAGLHVPRPAAVEALKLSRGPLIPLRTLRSPDRYSLPQAVCRFFSGGGHRNEVISATASGFRPCSPHDT